jgi:pyruvate/2-oxoglutarate dehydrogenase complex dihydrolipoamide acyltransferase (E2) component
MGSHSFPAGRKGREARPADAEATQGEGINWATERAAEVAEELGFDPSDLEGMQGSGKDGAVTVADVRNWGKEPDA